MQGGEQTEILLRLPYIEVLQKELIGGEQAIISAEKIIRGNNSYAAEMVWFRSRECRVKRRKLE